MPKEYNKIPIIECNEPLVAIPEDYFVFENPPPYQKLGANYQGKSPFYLREKVLASLIKAQEYLQGIKPGVSGVLFQYCCSVRAKLRQV